MPTPRRIVCIASIALAAGFHLAGLTGCSTYPSSFLYEPKPATASVRAAEGDELLALALTSIVGVRDGDQQAGRPPAVEMRLRVENIAADRVRFDPRTLTLLTGNLREFQPPRLQPAEPVELAPGESASVEAIFPFPDPPTDGALDLNSLQARWALNVDGRMVRQSASFDRRRPRYRRSYYYDYDYYRYPPHYYYDHGHGYFYPYRFHGHSYW